MTTNSTTPMKICTKCGEIFPATADFFHKKKTGHYGLEARCKVCRAEIDRQYYQANHEKVLERQHQWNAANREKIAENNRQWREANREKDLERQREYYRANRENLLEQKRQYYQITRDRALEKNRRYYRSHLKKLIEYARQYHQANRKKILERNYQYRQTNRERLNESSRLWSQANPEKRRINANRRRARKKQLPDTFTHEQWQECLEYWNGCCTVCGNQLRNLFGDVVPHADHWIPLAIPDCPGTSADNMICLCSSCNSSKNSSNPVEWLERKYGKRKAKQILERVEKYFEWVRNQQ